MKLRDWLIRHDIDQAAFGRLIRTTQASVSRYATGRRIPRPVIMARVVKATDGAVRPSDFYPDELENVA